MIFENTIIAMQSARGVRSHMNFTTLFNGVAFGMMGLFILLTTILLAVLLSTMRRPVRAPRPAPVPEEEAA